MIRAPNGLTEPQDGVMATRPAMAPEAAPRVVALPSRTRSTISQAATAVDAATWVLMNAMPAEPPALIAEPALNPNQPNHSRAAPSTTSGMLCGRIWSLPKPSRGRSTKANASAEAPRRISKRRSPIFPTPSCAESRSA